MPKKLQKTLQDYLFKIKQPTPRIHFSTKNWILSGCKHPKTLSFAVGRNLNDTDNHRRREEADISAKLSDIDRFLAENFKSLYVRDDNAETVDNAGGVLFESPRFGDPIPKLRSSNRFFVSPGLSGSLVEESRTSIATTTTTTNSDDAVCSLSSTTSSTTSTALAGKNGVVSLPEHCVAVLAHSPNPHADFRRSMSEVVEARLRRGESVDWGFMEEILFCYLDLNERRSHGFVLSAFVDLVVDLRRREADGGGASGRSPRSCVLATARAGRRRKRIERRARESNVRDRSP